MTKRVSPTQLDALPTGEAEAVIVRRFGWLRREREFIHEALRWQSEVTPRPDYYFRWHLPRLVMTCVVLREVFIPLRNPRILDLATYAPYAVMMDRYLRRHGITGSWERTSRNGSTQTFITPTGLEKVDTCPCVLGRERLPFPDGVYDAVLLTEVIEHLDQHPQLVLAELNRILRPGGLLLVTTPNGASWKKIRAAIEGHPGYDSPTFESEWGHRYEFSFYDMTQLLRVAGFGPARQLARNVYFDDPAGVRQFVEHLAVILVNALTGRFRVAAKLWVRRGSGLFLVGRKECEPRTADHEMMRI